jgi:hypothetical protein
VCRVKATAGEAPIRLSMARRRRVTWHLPADGWRLTARPREKVDADTSAGEPCVYGSGILFSPFLFCYLLFRHRIKKSARRCSTCNLSMSLHWYTHGLKKYQYSEFYLFSYFVLCLLPVMIGWWPHQLGRCGRVRLLPTKSMLQFYLEHILPDKVDSVKLESRCTVFYRLVLQIFTENSVSPGPCRRQWGSRYTIRVGLLMWQGISLPNPLLKDK